ncbi:MAG: amino acid permease [Elusimicrobia bacterium]|jgi:APA family basic amino acid/polyamine antiporter|nr:amino acid permease [Elusimicrobiota bacterium]
MNKRILTKKLNLTNIFAIASGAMISSGLFILPGLAFAKSGPAVVLAYFIAAVLVIPAVLSIAELVTAMPKAGGDYFFMERSFGPAVGTIGGLSSWFALSFKSAFALTGMSFFSHLIFPDISIFYIKLIAAGLCVFFTLLNIFSVKAAGRFQVILVFSLLSLLFLYIMKGFAYVDVQRFQPFAPHGLNAVFMTAGLIFISFSGLTKIAALAEEAENPGRNIPMGMFLSLGIIGAFYILTVFVTVGVLDASVLSGSETPISLGAEVIMGTPGIILLSVAALFAFISTANAGIMSASRQPMALSRDKLLPRFFSKVNKRFNTPHYGIIFTGIFMVMVVLFLNLEGLVKAASTLTILIFMLANVAVISMREGRILNYQPKFKTPLYPWTQIFGIIGSIVILIYVGQAALLTIGSVVVIGIAVYFLYGRKRYEKEFALIHLVERIMDKSFSKNILESELKDIIRERDDITRDRFDKIIESSTIIDIKERLNLEEFLSRMADIISKEMDIERQKAYDALHAREKDTSTAISPFVAIPHIVIDGKERFEIFMARAKKGIEFTDQDNIKAVFILIGTPDERNFHLKALSAIAQIVQAENFRDIWMNALRENNLRDIILLGKRARHN